MGAIWITILSAIMGAFIGALFSYLSDKRNTQEQYKRDLSFKIYDEFHSDSMLESRIKADKFLLNNEEIPFEKIFTHDNKQFYHIARIFHFFSKLSMLYNHDQLNRKLAKEFFRIHFVYWNDTHFSRYVNDIKNDNKYAEIINLNEIFKGE